MTGNGKTAYLALFEGWKPTWQLYISISVQIKQKIKQQQIKQKKYNMLIREFN